MKLIDHQQNSRTTAMQQVIRQLRADDLNNGHCFMIFDDELPEDQAYYEYPNGLITIEQVDKNNFDAPRVLIKQLTQKQIAAVKQKHEVFH